MRRTTPATRSAFLVTDVIRRVFTVAVLTGLAVGLVMAALLHVTTTPLILRAEVYERAAHVTEGKSLRIDAPRPTSPYRLIHGHEAHGPPPAAEGWSPTEGLQRTAATSVATIAVATGYAFLLLGCMMFARVRIDARSGLLWGLAGFAATGLAPALGLAPELPGSASAGLLARQIWWAVTVLTTALGLYLVLRQPQGAAKAAGVALIVAPHLIGAPQASAFESTAPAELAARFAAASLVVHAVMWCLVGLGAGWLWRRGAGTDARMGEAHA